MKNNDIFIYRMEFDKTRWSCPWNNAKKGAGGLGKRKDGGGLGVVGV